MYYVIVYLRRQIYCVEPYRDEDKAKTSAKFWSEKLNTENEPRYKVILTKKVD